MSAYRREPELPHPIEVDRTRLEGLERCEAVLRALDESTFRIEPGPSNRSLGRRAWNVELYAEGVTETWPSHLCHIEEGKGPTVRAAVEDARGWLPLEPWRQPQPPVSNPRASNPGRVVSWVVAVAVGLGLLWGGSSLWW